MQLILVAGEASGDRYAADLVEELRRRHPDWQYCGMGAAASREAGVELQVDSTELAVVGLVEVLRHYPKIRAAMRCLKETLREQKPDLLILIDYPEFNLKLAGIAHRMGSPSWFCVSPQRWAWRAGLVRKIRRRINHMAVILPFEEDFYRHHQVSVSYAGHPLVGKARASEDAATLQQRWNIDSTRPVIGLCPGSRRNELNALMPICIGAVEELQTHPSAPQFVLAIAPGMSEEEYVSRLPEDTPIRCLNDDIYNVMSLCTMAMAASGTITLQLALMKVPFCMMYRMASLTYAIAHLLVRIPRYCLPNIIVGKDLVTELIQSDATGPAIAAELRPWLDSPERLEEVRTQLQGVQKHLGPPAGMTRLADRVEALLESPQ